MVKRTFQMADQGLNLQEIADHLNQEGFSTPHGSRSHRTQVRRILLHKDVYLGTYIYRSLSVAGEHPKLLVVSSIAPLALSTSACPASANQPNDRC